MTMATDSEMVRLDKDFLEIRRIIDETPDFLRTISDVSNASEHIFRLVISDLFWQIWFHSMGVHALLKAELASPVLAVQRAVYEAVTNLSYINRHADSATEAAILLATSYMKEMVHFAAQPAVVSEREAILERMPPGAVAEARRRLEMRPHTWSGKTVRAMTEQAHISGYSSVYAYLSAEVHGSIVGRHVRLVPNGDGSATLHTGRALSANEVETHSNFARRALHGAFQIVFYRLLPTHRATVNSTNPFQWNPPGLGEVGPAV